MMSQASIPFLICLLWSLAPEPPLKCTIPFNPIPVVVSDSLQFSYELELANTSGHDLAIDRIVISDNDKTLRTLARADLQSCLSPSDSLFRAGVTGVVYIDIALAKTAALNHTISVRDIKTGKTHSIKAQCPVSASSVPVVSSPFSEGTWVAIYSAAWTRGHRRVIYETDGIKHIPGRFAIDFMLLNEAGQFASGDPDSITHWFGYGKDILAVADGVVASTKNDFPESPTVSGHPGYPHEQASGNYVSIRISDHQYVFFEHLKPGSVVVRPGQRVKQGDVIGKLGFTGQSTGPHLHLHVADSDSPLNAEGIPFAFDNFNLLGNYPDFSVFGSSPWTPVKGKRNLAKQRPPTNSVIQFNKK